MRYRTIGGTTVGAIGLGGMPMSIEGLPESTARSGPSTRPWMRA